MFFSCERGVRGLCGVVLEFWSGFAIGGMIFGVSLRVDAAFCLCSFFGLEWLVAMLGREGLRGRAAVVAIVRGEGCGGGNLSAFGECVGQFCFRQRFLCGLFW